MAERTDRSGTVGGTANVMDGPSCACRRCSRWFPWKTPSRRSAGQGRRSHAVACRDRRHVTSQHAGGPHARAVPDRRRRAAARRAARPCAGRTSSCWAAARRRPRGRRGGPGSGHRSTWSSSGRSGVPGQPELAMGGRRRGRRPRGRRAGRPRWAQVAPRGVRTWPSNGSGPRWRVVLQRFRRGPARVPLTGRIAVVVDDGIATGSTARAACAVARALGAARVVLAAPVCAREACGGSAAGRRRAGVPAAPRGLQRGRAVLRRLPADGGRRGDRAARLRHRRVGVAARPRWRHGVADQAVELRGVDASSEVNRMQLLPQETLPSRSAGASAR